MGDVNDKEPLQPSINHSENMLNEDKEYPGGSTSSRNGSGEFGYEELSNGLTCPTCQGTGKIPRGE